MKQSNNKMEYLTINLVFPYCDSATQTFLSYESTHLLTFLPVNPKD